MFFYEGLSCPVCKRAFSKEDDIVACPQCGLPHHRACWYQLSHCQQADKHGTDEQWSREKARKAQEIEPETKTSDSFTGKICPRCHTRNKEYAEFCTHCFSPLQSDDWHSVAPPPPVVEFTPFQSPCPAGEIYTDMERIGTATAKDIAAVVGTNTVYYIPRFRRIHSGASGCWNWAAFLLGPYWLLFRKQYLVGGLFLALRTGFRLFLNYWALPVMLAQTEEEYLTALNTVATSRLAIPATVLLSVLLILHILLGHFGNTLYKRHCERVIRTAKEQTPDLSPAELSLSGGTSMVAAMLCYFIPYVILNLAAVFMIM